MKERPILFSGEMVRAILAGRKTQIRRVMKVQPEGIAVVNWSAYEGGATSLARTDQGVIQLPPCPYGKPGDHLWLKETYSEGYTVRHENGERIKIPHFTYKADKEICGLEGVFVQGKRSDGKPIRTMADLYKWKSGRFMPRIVSRITLEIKNVRVERLQEISAADIEAEGTPLNPMKQPVYRNDLYQRIRDFKFLWDEINGKKYPWESNPFCWVIDFQKVEQQNEK